ncbi:ABC transporter, substrate-binding protein [Streptococcus sp. DD11]|nr:ABC transporter, substrate-binding protein [Streptococcus sp. DD11]
MTTRWAQFGSAALLLLPLFVGMFFPTVTLDSTTVSAKGFHFPLAEGNSAAVQQDEGTSSQYLKPDTSTYFTKGAYEKEMRAAAKKYVDKETIEVTTENYMEVMEVIYDYPENFVGKTLEFTGFVYNDPSDSKNQFLFRFGIIHCIADSGVYGLLTTGSSQHYDDNTWIHAKGKIAVQYHKSLGQSLPALEIESLDKVEKPDNPYVYRVF